VTDERATVPLTVDTDLEVAVDGRPVTVTSSEDRVFVELGSVPALVRTLRRPPAVDLTPIDATLRRADVALEVRVRHRTVAALGAGTRPSRLLQRVGVEPVELRLTGVLSAVGAEIASGYGRARRAVRGFRRRTESLWRRFD